jgi:hypothetical protein
LGQVTDGYAFIDAHGSGGRFCFAEDYLKKSGLAGSVRPDEPDFFPGIDSQGEIIKQDAGPVALREIVYTNHDTFLFAV